MTERVVLYVRDDATMHNDEELHVELFPGGGDNFILSSSDSLLQSLMKWRMSIYQMPDLTWAKSIWSKDRVQITNLYVWTL